MQKQNPVSKERWGFVVSGRISEELYLNITPALPSPLRGGGLGWGGKGHQG
jgi:hypothetical protein